MHLSDLSKGSSAVVEHVSDAHADDFIARRLRDLGFVPGEPVRVVAHGPWGAEPMLIQIGSTRFALRRAEARRVRVRPVPAAQPVGVEHVAHATHAAHAAGMTSATSAPGMALARSEPTDHPSRP